MSHLRPVLGRFARLLARRTAALAIVAASFALAPLLGLPLQAVTGPHVVTPEQRPDPAPHSGPARHVEALSARYECSTGGLPSGVIPAHAIVQEPSGHYRLTTFDEGWAYHKDGDPSTVLVRVCRR